MAEDSVTIAALRAQIAAVRAQTGAIIAETARSEERRRAAEASLDEITRLTTFEDYLRLIHEACAVRVNYDPDSLRNTRGGATNARDRITPTVIAPRDGFEEEQAATYRELCEVFQDKRLFPTKSEVIGAQDTIREFLITSEPGLARFTNVAQVTPATNIVNQFIGLGNAQVNGGPGLKVRFISRGDLDEDIEAAFAPVDGIWNCDGPRLLEELQSPHKLSEVYLQQALDDGTGCPRRMFETKPIINGVDYMIESGTTRAYLNTGMAYMFFNVRESEATTLYYNLVMPPQTSAADPAETSACQLAIFIRRCLTSQKRDADWIRNAVESNARFLVDPEAQLNLMSSPLSSTSEVVTPGKEDYKPPKWKGQSIPDADRASRLSDVTSGDDSSPTRHRSATRSRTREENSHRAADTSTISASGETGGTRSSTTTRSTFNSNCMLCAFPDAARRYCSQACLRGLMYSFRTEIPRELGAACPNATRHSQSSKHQVTSDQFHDSLRHQLVRSHTHAIEQLGLRGSSGHLFAITLCSHGYRFVGKGSRSDQVPTLVHEVDVYEALHPLQGQYIPVCLGLLELEGPYYLPAPNHLTHFLLLSYAGIQLWRCPKQLPPAEEVISSTKTALMKLHGFNLLHHDFRVENMVWNTELHRAMIIDFGESILPGRLGDALSMKYDVSSDRMGGRTMIQKATKSRSFAGVEKTQKARSRHMKSTIFMDQKRRELSDVESEILRVVPAQPA